MALRRLSRTVALLRYHRPSQFAWRLYRIVQRQLRRRLPERFVFTTGLRMARWKPGAKSAFETIAAHRFQLWPKRSAHASEMAEGRFRFLSLTRDLKLDSTSGGVRIDWSPDAPRLWRFHLHCQEDLLELAAAAGAAAAYDLIGSWMSDPSHASPTRDPDAWHPFCISRRLPVWLSLAATDEPPPEIADAFWRSIADQVAWLEQNCERDLGGNHLLENLTAIYLATSFLDFDPPLQIESIERQILDQLDEQLLPSGEHYERTPTYHALMMVSVLQCADTARFRDSEILPRLSFHADRMQRFAEWIRQPNGQFPLLSDSVGDETPDLNKLFAWGDEVGGGNVSNSDATFDPSANYWTHQTDNGDRLLFDSGPLACDHLPAHGHADLLQITATLGGRDAIVDTGNYQYEAGEMRQRCRQTAAHNVLQLGDLQQCDLWSSFRMGRRGHPGESFRGSFGDYQWCSAMHDGFGCPVGRVILATERSWTIIDWVGQFSGTSIASSRLHWHPDWRVTIDEAKQFATAIHPGIPARNFVVSGLEISDELSVEDGVYCPNFGEQYDNQILVNRIQFSVGGWLGFHISLQGSQPSPAPKVSGTARRLNITTDSGESLVLSAENGCAI